MLKYLRFFSVVPVAVMAQTDLQRPQEAERPLVIQLEKVQQATPPRHTLSETFELQVIAGPPLVQHPIMGCADAEGNLYVGDAVGVNWNKSELEQAPPNRVIKLIDTNQDGIYDKSVVFADHMTFPQGAAWLDGSLYVASPPGIWKLTDKDGDGVAEEREMIVSGFDYTGNAADVHGPKVHPNGRLYWCHGRKGHKVIQKDGKLIHEGKASGVWSCLPDGSDVRWHALGGADNPTSLAFTDQGEIVGTTNLYKSQPRSDTLMLWQYGGIYPRRDQMQVVEGKPITFVDMPALYDYGHVAVSGISFWNGFDPSKRAPLMVTHFNTQRLVRMEFEKEGSAYKLTENEFLKIHEDDVHLTDVFEDPQDGSLILLNTGGWFRIGCPSSLMAKPEQRGSIYRIKSKASRKTPVYAAQVRFQSFDEAKNALVNPQDAQSARLAMEFILESLETQAPSSPVDDVLKQALVGIGQADLDLYGLHAWLRLSRHLRLFDASALVKATSEIEIRHLLWYFRDPSLEQASILPSLLPYLKHEVAAVRTLALETLSAHPESTSQVAMILLEQLKKNDSSTLALVESFLTLLKPEDAPHSKAILDALLLSDNDANANLGLRILAVQTGIPVDASWHPKLESRLSHQPSLELIDVIARAKAPNLMARLEALSQDASQPTTIRIKAMAAFATKSPSDETLKWLSKVLSLGSPESLASKITAAKTLARFPLTPEQIQAIAPLFSQFGPIELNEALPIMKKSKEERVLTPVCEALAKNPALLSQQESTYRSVLSQADPKIFESLIAPAYKNAELALARKRDELDKLSTDAEKLGNAELGRKHFAQGKGSCLACHRVGDLGGIVGPNLSQIGGIRKERDILESILFPSNTLARDYESQVFELRGGESVMGVVRSHAAEGIIISDLAGQSRTLAHDQIVSQITLPTSLMPMGLENTMSRQELLDLIAYFRSLK